MNPASPQLSPDEFRCAKCGRVFKFPATTGEIHAGHSHRHRVGGADWCDDCYSRRFRRQTAWRRSRADIDYSSPFFRPV